MAGEVKHVSVDRNTLRDVIEGGYVYVDKTNYLYEIISSAVKNFFLSRPRRFGKSFLLDTVAEIFRSDREHYIRSRIIEQKFTNDSYPNPSAKPTVSVIKTELDLCGEIFKWYDGYTWDGKTIILNPISVNSLFSRGKFRKYWTYTAPNDNFLEQIFSSNPF
jgi:hypothetical protein